MKSNTTRHARWLCCALVVASMATGCVFDKGDYKGGGRKSNIGGSDSTTTTSDDGGNPETQEPPPDEDSGTGEDAGLGGN